jgi:membrane associated rhomboid family serine protease
MPGIRINLPPLTRALLLVLLVLSLLNASFSVRSLIRVQAVPFLAIIPQASLRYPYTVLTAALIETNLVSFVISAITLFYGGRYLERAWSSPEFAKFVLFVTVIPNLLTFAIYCLWSFVTGSDIRA